MALLNIFLPLVSLLVGAGVTYWVDTRRRDEERRKGRVDDLRGQRANAYRQFIRSAHNSAHLIARTAPGCPEPLRENVEGVRALVDSEVARDYYEMSLIADQATLDAASAIRSALYKLLEAIKAGAEYMDPTYRERLKDYQGCRESFLKLARAEVTGP